MHLARTGADAHSTTHGELGVVWQHSTGATDPRHWKCSRELTTRVPLGAQATKVPGGLARPFLLKPATHPRFVGGTAGINFHPLGDRFHVALTIPTMEPAITALHSSPHSTDTMSEPQYLKMEDVHHSTSASPAPSAATDSAAWSTSSPAPIVVQSKPTKKRKSWGQALPEPKTALPPRKRAKTEDEKEQRRIERIKRNRAAAHNSRERKRQETEDLAVKLAKANAELAAFKAHFGELPSHIVLPEVKVEVDDSGVITASAATPAPSLTESHGEYHCCLLLRLHILTHHRLAKRPSKSNSTS